MLDSARKLDAGQCERKPDARQYVRNTGAVLVDIYHPSGSPHPSGLSHPPGPSHPCLDCFSRSK